MCKKFYICTDSSKWDTCRVEKMGCKGCHYFRPLYKLVSDGPEINKNYWKKKGAELKHESI